jgi:hypothetical protein
MSRAVLACRDGSVAVLKVYTDESGIHEDSPVVTVAACCAKPSVWNEWTKKWNAAKRPIKVYHAADAQNLHGEFEGWSKAGRDEIVKRIIPVIADADIRSVVIGINLEEYRKAISNKPGLADLFQSTFGPCFQWVMQTVILLEAQAGSPPRFCS